MQPGKDIDVVRDTDERDMNSNQCKMCRTVFVFGDVFIVKLERNVDYPLDATRSTAIVELYV